MTTNRRKKLARRALAASRGRSYTAAGHLLAPAPPLASQTVAATLARSAAGEWTIVVDDPRAAEPIAVDWALENLERFPDEAVRELTAHLAYPGWQLAPGQNWPAARPTDEVVLGLCRSERGRRMDHCAAIWQAAGLGFQEIHQPYGQAVAELLNRRGIEFEVGTGTDPRHFDICFTTADGVVDKTCPSVRWREDRGWTALTPAPGARAGHDVADLGVAPLAPPEQVAARIIAALAPTCVFPDGAREPLPAWSLKPANYDANLLGSGEEDEDADGYNPLLEACLAAYLTHPAYLAAGGDRYGLTLARIDPADPATPVYGVTDRITGQVTAFDHGIATQGYYTDPAVAHAAASALSNEERRHAPDYREDLSFFADGARVAVRELGRPLRGTEMIRTGLQLAQTAGPDTLEPALSDGERWNYEIVTGTWLTRAVSSLGVRGIRWEPWPDERNGDHATLPAGMSLKRARTIWADVHAEFAPWMSEIVDHARSGRPAGAGDVRAEDAPGGWLVLPVRR